MQDNTATKAFFDQRAAHWDEFCVHDSKKLAALVTLAGVTPGCRVLDVACGTGVLFPELLNHGAASVLGVDLSDGMIEMARHKSSDPRITLVAGDLLELSQTGFDVAILYSAYPHFGDKAALRAKLAAVLAPDGRFMVAHSQSRAVINGRHHGPEVEMVSTPLRPVGEEAADWEKEFTIDLMGDSPELYFFSGRRNAAVTPPAGGTA